MLAWLAQLVKSVVTALPTEVESLQTQLATVTLEHLRKKLSVYQVHSLEHLNLLNLGYNGQPVAPKEVQNAIKCTETFFAMF